MFKTKFHYNLPMWSTAQKLNGFDAETSQTAFPVFISISHNIEVLCIWPMIYWDGGATKPCQLWRDEGRQFVPGIQG